MGSGFKSLVDHLYMAVGSRFSPTLATTGPPFQGGPFVWVQLGAIQIEWG